ncbi:ABC transporter permease [Brachymonas sp.]|uniref:ABC transporter permease n=1 Tax=Brachymonas sp. TaxID=1936292 RepID=UPI0035B3413E
MRIWLLSVLYLCRKELLAILKDPKSRVVLAVPVIVQSLLFGYVATFDIPHVSYALLDESRGAAAADFIARLEGSGTFQRVETLPNASGIDGAIMDGRAMAVVHFGPRFDADLQAGRTVPLQLVLDGRNSNTAAIASSYVQTVAQDFNARWRAEHGGGSIPLRIESRAWFNPQLDTRWQFMPSLIASLSILQTLLLTALSVAREREQGTFDQLLVTPLTPAQIMIGKAIPPILVGVVQATLVLLVARWWFRVPMAGGVGTLYLGLFLFTLASVGIGLAISAFSANMQQAMLYAFVFIMPMIMLSGLTTPVSNMPEAMRWITSVNPVRYAIDLVRRVYLEGASTWEVGEDIWPLLLISAGSLPVAAWLFRHRMT